MITVLLHILFTALSWHWHCPVRTVLHNPVPFHLHPRIPLYPVPLPPLHR